MNPPLSWNQWLKQLRTKVDLTQEQLAEQVGCSVQTIGALELGRRRPSRPMVERLAKVLEVTPGEREAFVRLARAHVPPTEQAPVVQAPPPATPVGRTQRLPMPPTPLIGRAQEAVDLAQRLQDPQCRLVTLVGPGGIGKTRLALQVAHDLQDHFANGVAFVPLADVVAMEQVAAAIMDVVQYPPQSTQADQATLLDWLRFRKLLLVLDNWEQLLSATPLVQAILQDAPNVRLLVTSRERLHLQAEWVVPLDGLAVPMGNDGASIAHADAVVLFVERATRAAGRFVLDADNQAAVAAICRRLDGLPLALELAAARTKHLSAQALLGRLDRALTVLAGGARDLPERQQAIRSTMQWSYDLLRSNEQALFRRLAVFRGGWTLEAAEAVGQGVDGEVFDLLAHLVDKSLVIADTEREPPRYRMLEPIRQYAEELLAASGEAPTVCEHHAAYCLAWASEAAAHVNGAEPRTWLGRIDEELPNIRTALTSLCEQGDGARALQLVGALSGYWSTRGSLQEGRAWLEQALALPCDDQRLRAGALHSLAFFAVLQGDIPAAITHIEAGLLIYRSLDDQRGLGRLLNFQGWVVEQHGRSAEAEALGKESLALLQQVGDREGTAGALRMLAGIAQSSGEYAQASVWLEEALRIGRELQNQGLIASTTSRLGQLAERQGHFARAEQLLNESLAMFQAMGMERSVVANEVGRGLLAVRQGHNGWGGRLLRAQAALLIEARLASYLGPCLLGLAVVAGEGGQAEVAARLLGKAQHLMTQGSLQLDAHDQQLAERVKAANTDLVPAAWNAAWTGGQTLSLEQVGALATQVSVGDDTEQRPASAASPFPLPATGEVLTAREIEVLQLLARGATNQAIADALVISIHTAKVHVARVLTKLDVGTRTEAAHWVHSLGIS